MSSKKDPFNFDDIYAATGNDNFIRKPMGELKKQQPSKTSVANEGRGPSVASTPPKHNSAPATVVVKASDFEDLLGASKAKAPAPSASGRSTTQQAKKNAIGMEDLFGDVATAPAVPSKPAPTKAPAPASGTDPFDVFGDVHGAEPAVAAAPAKEFVSSASDDHWEAFTDARAAAASAQPAATPALPHYPPVPAFNASFPDPFSGAPSAAAHRSIPPAAAMPTNGKRPAYAPNAESGSAAAFPSYQGPSSSERVVDSPAAVPRSNSVMSDHGPGSAHGGREYSGSGSNAAPYWSSGAGDTDYPYQSSDGGLAAARAQRAGSGGGVVGLLRGIGKKAVKAAKEGLQHLESALERIDQQGQGQGQQAGAQGAAGQQTVRRDRSGRRDDHTMEGYGYVGGSAAVHGFSSGDDESPHAGYRHSQPRSGSGSGSGREGRPMGAGVGEDPRTVAETLMALPLEERREVLGTLPPGQRAKVAQVLAELEARAARAPPVSSLAVDVKTSAVDLSAFEAPAPAAPVPTTTPVAAPAVSAVAGPRPGSGSMGTEPGWGRMQSAAPAPPRSTPQQQQAAAEHHDLLGFGAESHAAAATVRVTSPAPVVDDLLGFGGSPTAAAAPAPAAFPQPAAAPAVPSAAAAAEGPTRPAEPTFMPHPPPQPAVPAHTPDVDELHDFFTGGSAAASAAPTPANMSHANSVHDFFGTGPPAPAAARPAAAAAASRPAAGAAGIDMLGGLHHDVDVDVSAHQDLYADTEGTEGEPEERRRLRAARLADKHAKMKAALAEKVAREEEESRRRAEQVELKESLKASVDAWKNKNKGNIRGLLASLQSVLWEGSGWQPVGMGDLLEPAQIRKVWMRANLLVHPDKVRQRNGGPEQVAIADMVFDTVKDAWNSFQAAGR